MGKTTIVYVEDEPDYQKLVSRILEPTGLQLRMAENGQDGMKLLERENPGLLLLDVNLPDTDGFSICRTLRQNKDWKDLQILMLTVRRQPKEWLQGFESGADDYLSKPLNPPDLIERVEACLGPKKERPILTAQDSEYRLIQAAVAGNRAAFDILIQQYRQDLLRSMQQQSGNAAEAEDIVASAYTVALKRLDQFRGQCSFWTWLYEIAINEFHRRHRRRDTQMISMEELSRDDESWLPPSMVERDIAEQILKEDCEDDLAQAALSSVPKRTRRLLEWHVVKGIPQTKIAERLKVPTGTVWSRIASARAAVRSAYEGLKKKRDLRQFRPPAA